VVVTVVVTAVSVGLLIALAAWAGGESGISIVIGVLLVLSAACNLALAYDWLNARARASSLLRRPGPAGHYPGQHLVGWLHLVLGCLFVFAGVSKL
jgi:hypothetical protein